VLPADWRSFALDYRYRETDYHVIVQRTDHPSDEERYILDGQVQAEPFLTLVDDGHEHRVEVFCHSPDELR